jgi:hypothetical protein
MDRRRSASRALQVAGILATLVLFIVVTALQSRWIAQLSDAELQHAKIRLQVSVRAIRTDINRELTRAYALFQLPAGAPSRSWGKMTAEAYAIWRQTAQFPGLIHRLLLVRPSGEAGDLEMAAYDADTRRYDPIAWPAELNDLRKQLALPFTAFEAFGVRTFTGVALADAPVLVLPVIPAFSSGFADVTGWLLIELDQRLLLTTMLPETIGDDVERPEQFDYQIARDGFPNRIQSKECVLKRRRQLQPAGDSTRLSAQ